LEKGIRDNKKIDELIFLLVFVINLFAKGMMSASKGKQTPVIF